MCVHNGNQQDRHNSKPNYDVKHDSIGMNKWGVFRTLPPIKQCCCDGPGCQMGFFKVGVQYTVCTVLVLVLVQFEAVAKSLRLQLLGPSRDS